MRLLSLMLVLTCVVATGWFCFAAEERDGVTYYGNDDLRTSKRSASALSRPARPSDEIMRDMLEACNSKYLTQDADTLTLKQIDGFMGKLERLREEAAKGIGKDYEAAVPAIDSCKKMWLTVKKYKTERGNKNRASYR